MAGVGRETVVRCSALNYVPSMRTELKLHEFYVLAVQRGLPEEMKAMRALVESVRIQSLRYNRNGEIEVNISARPTLLAIHETLNRIAPSCNDEWLSSSAYWLAGLSGFAIRYEFSGGREVDDQSVQHCFRCAAEGFLSTASLMEEEKNPLHEPVRLLAMNSTVNEASAFFRSQPEATRTSNKKLQDYIKTKGVMRTCHEIIDLQPWNWVQARNALIWASVIRDAHECRKWWSLLTNISEEFLNLDMRPAGYPSIAENPDMTWFRNNILTQISRL